MAPTNNNFTLRSGLGRKKIVAVGDGRIDRVPVFVGEVNEDRPCGSSSTMVSVASFDILSSLFERLKTLGQKLERVG
jgi:hypothetical protein